MKILPVKKQFAIFCNCFFGKKNGIEKHSPASHSNLKAKKDLLTSIILQSINESEREKEQILNSLSERVCYLDLDFNIKWLNSSGLKSISPDILIKDVLGHNCYNTLHNRQTPCVNCPVVTTLNTGWPWKEEVEHDDGSTYVISSQPVFDDNGTMTGIIEVQLDISLRKEVERSLERSRKSSRALLDAIPDLLLVFNNNGNFIDYHPAADFDLITTKNPEGKPLTQIMPRALAEDIISHSKQLLTLGTVRNFDFTDSEGNDPKSYETRLIKTGDDKNICIIRDVSQEKSRQKEILFKSFHDSLTGLYNRAYFEEEMNRIEHSRRSLPTSILIIDVNGLKFTNDAFGHEYGDKLLQSVSKILSETCRKSDVIARTGGDEFAIILPASPLNKALKLSERILTACLDSKDEDFFVRPSVSVGFAEKTDNSVNLREVMKIADEKMYRMKLANRTQHLNSLISDIIETMKKRSFEDENHIKRCVHLSEIFAKRLNMTASTAENILKLARLHDVGKIRIPKEILINSGRLSAEEHNLIKQHSIIGFRIAKAIPDYASVADMILYHHERWDGTGYPSGLDKKNIPLESRIFLIIDSYDAMSHTSPFKKAKSFKEAVAELRHNSGKQFDPDLVEIFIEILKEEKDKHAT